VCVVPGHGAPPLGLGQGGREDGKDAARPRRRCQRPGNTHISVTQLGHLKKIRVTVIFYVGLDYLKPIYYF